MKVKGGSTYVSWLDKVDPFTLMKVLSLLLVAIQGPITLMLKDDENILFILRKDTKYYTYFQSTYLTEY